MNASIDCYNATGLCKSQQSAMVSLHSVEEEKFIADMVDSTEYQHFFTWLGGKRNSTNSRFEWGDGSVFGYEHFQYPEDEVDSCISLHRVRIFRSYFWVWMTDNCFEKLVRKIVCITYNVICSKQLYHLLWSNFSIAVIVRL